MNTTDIASIKTVMNYIDMRVDERIELSKSVCLS